MAFRSPQSRQSKIKGQRRHRAISRAASLSNTHQSTASYRRTGPAIVRTSCDARATCANVSVALRCVAK